MSELTSPRRPGRPPTLREIAERAGVHTSTVSRVLRRDEPLEGWSDTATRVRAVAEELGYRPNPWAASLRTRRTMTVGVVMPRLTDGVVATMFQGVEEAATDSGYSVLLSSPPDGLEAQRRAIGLLVDRQVDGLLLSSLHSPADDFLATLPETLPPVVLLNRHADTSAPFVAGDDCHGGRLAAEHLLDLGYRRIALIAGPEFATTARDRSAGFLAGLADAGATPPPRWVRSSGFDVAAGVEAATTILQGPDRPDAVFAVSDSIAIGVLGVARDLGLRIPDDLGLVGYNDIPVVAQLPVPLTTVHAPARDIGAAGLRLLLDALGGAPVPPRRLPVRLIPRDTTTRR